MALQHELEKHGNTKVQVLIYPGVAHAFMNESPHPYKSFADRKAMLGFPPYNADQASRAWLALHDFFDTWLHGKPKEEL